MERGLVSDKLMYITKLILPSQRAYQLDRTIPGSANDFVAQQTDEFQECVYTVLCAKLLEIDELMTEISASEWKYEVNPQFAPIQEGLDRFSGTISCRRLLPLSEGSGVGTTTQQKIVSSYTIILE